MNNSISFRQSIGLNRARGLSLVELMVALVIGLFLVAGTTTVFVNSRKSSDVDDSVARLQETARYAMSVIESDVVMANFWGLGKDGSSIVNKPSQTNAAITSTSLLAGTDAEDCGATYAIDVERPVEASNNSYAIGCPAMYGEVLSADTLTIRRAEIATAALDVDRLQLCASRNNVAIIKGTACPSTDEIHNLIVHGYYVDRRSTQSTTYPALRRKTLVAETGVGPDFNDVEIIPGVEDMQIQIGWDGLGASAEATSYYNPGNASMTAAGQVVAVRVWLLIRAETTDGEYRDNKTYEYGDRSIANGITADINVASSRTLAYRPADNFRRLLISRTIFIRNSVGT